MLARELVSQRIVVMLRSDRLRANGGLYRNDSGPYRDRHVQHMYSHNKTWISDSQCYTLPSLKWCIIMSRGWQVRVLLSCSVLGLGTEFSFAVSNSSSMTWGPGSISAGDCLRCISVAWCSDSSGWASPAGTYVTTVAPVLHILVAPNPVESFPDSLQSFCYSQMSGCFTVVQLLQDLSSELLG